VKKRGEDGLLPIGAIMRNAGMSPPSAHKLRLIDAAAIIAAGEDEREIAYHHTVFCQTALPYRRVEERIWERTNGFLSLSIEAGRALHPETQKWVNLPLPFGPKARLIQIHLDTQATLHDKPTVELEGSMTSFIKQLQGRAPNGPELRKFKDQAASIAGALFRFAAAKEGRTFQIDAKIVSGFELWYPRDERQHVLFPSFVRLSDEYFSTLREHAVPLDHRAVAAMQHNALMLDIYKWLAQRLCRVPANRPTFIVWPLVQAQFGQGYTRIRAFRSVFVKALKTVVTQYPGAKVEADGRGLKLYRSRPPILPKELKAIS
jgi:Plasmid encoded RepA protein